MLVDTEGEPIDVPVELVHYIDEIKPLLKSKISVGKKIDFIAQEMLREEREVERDQHDPEVQLAHSFVIHPPRDLWIPEF